MGTSNILVIDDIRSFDDLGASRNLIFTYARTSQNGIALLERERFDGLWLDYNLGWENPDRSDTGLRVAEWLRSRHASFAHLEVTIITDKDEMAKVLLDVLLASGYRARASNIGHEWDHRNGHELGTRYTGNSADSLPSA
jgi:CheY-like chemotaxis protein